MTIEIGKVDFDLKDMLAKAMSSVENVMQVKSDGGPSSYYDLLPGWVTFNDFMEYKAKTQWHGYALHLKDIGKAICRFGVKQGTTDAYDARKIIYSGLRLLGMIEGKDAMRAELVKLLDDPQFQ